MITDMLWWCGFVAFVLAMLALDLGVFHRKAHEVKTREALIWTGVWVFLALAFNLGIYLGLIGSYSTVEVRHQAALEFFTAYLMEKSLSADNVFVFALLLSYFAVRPIYQHKVLFWGIISALMLRGAMIFAGIALLHAFHWVMYLFGAILIFGGVKICRNQKVEVDPQKNLAVRLVRQIMPVAADDHQGRFFIRSKRTFMVTPLFIVLVLIEWSDLVFAIDSIPAVLAVTDDPFIVFTSNVMAILGLRSLYFALGGIIQRFHLLQYGLAAILVFIGIKMLAADFYKVPTFAALGAIATILVLSMIASLFWPPRHTGIETNRPRSSSRSR